MVFLGASGSEARQSISVSAVGRTRRHSMESMPRTQRSSIADTVDDGVTPLRDVSEAKPATYP
jgi:hypothetical protein